MKIPRRSFLIATPGLALGLRRFALAQIPFERGRFGNDDLPLARAELLELVNAERAAAGLTALQLDELACKVANEHALDMAARDFLSHWGSDGLKPYHRFSFAGGIDAVQENVSQAHHIASVTPPGVRADLRVMHTKMHDEVPPNDGHRRSILAPQNTHAGFGITLNEYSVSLVELYVARYLKLDSIHMESKRKTSVTLTGKFYDTTHFLQQVDVFYEPLPQPPGVDWLRQPRPYSMPDDRVALRPKVPKGLFYSDHTTGDFDWGYGEFKVPVKLFRNTPGIYTVVFWIRRVPDEKAFPVTGICIISD